MIKAILFASTGALALAACGGSAPDAAATQEPAVTSAATPSGPLPVVSEAAPAPSDSAAAPEPTAASATPEAATSTAFPTEEERSTKAARAVLETWAQALEAHQFGRAWQQFLSPPASRAAYVRWWSRYRTIHVSLGPGEADAGMGSIYYTVPATLTGMTMAGKPFRLQGDVVVRRVNDVDGATPAQLRWHIGTADLKDTGIN